MSTQTKKNNKSEKNKWWFYVIGGVALILAFVIYKKLQPKELTSKDLFAQCLAEKGAKMYGAYWCSSCKKQKELFGDSFDHAPYQECATPGVEGQVKPCREAEIEAYPTWVFADGSRETGVQTLADLGQKTGCQLSELGQNE